MKMMETKLEKLIALVNKTSTPQAKPPGKKPTFFQFEFCSGSAFQI